MDIQEIPLDITENITNNVEDNPTIQEDLAQDIPVEETKLEVKPIKAARAKGRPKGAPNKGPSKPRVKKAQVQETPVEEEEEVYEPTSPKRNLRIPADPSSSDVAAAMLKLLQDQTNSRQSRKQRLYNSWFA
jgi:hypothetical protein